MKQVSVCFFYVFRVSSPFVTLCMYCFAYSCILLVYYVQDLIEELMEFNLRTGSITLQKDVHCTRTIVSTDQVRGNDHVMIMVHVHVHVHVHVLTCLCININITLSLPSSL